MQLDRFPQNRESLRRQLERMSRAYGAAGIGIWDWDLRTGGMTYCARARAICGFSDDRPVTLEMVRDVTHPDDLPRTWHALQEALNPDIRADVSYVYRIVRLDNNEVRWVRARGVAEFAPEADQQKAIRYTGTLEDITEAELTRRALAESEARLRVAVDAAQMAVWELDLETDEIRPSPELNRLYGFPPDARPTTDDFRSRYAPGERERVQKAWAEAVARGENMLQSRARNILPDGSERIFVIRAALVPDEESGRRRAMGVVFDVTDQVRQEERVAASAKELMHRLKNMASIISVVAGRTWPRDERYTSFVGRVQSMTAAADLMFGRSEFRVPVAEVVRRIIAPFAGEGEQRFALGETPAVDLGEKQASGLAMVLYELCTNATKYGSLSADGGIVRIGFALADSGDLTIGWKESGGPPVTAPERTGFGTVLLLEGGLAAPNRVEIDFQPDGLAASIFIKLSAAAPA